MLAWQQYLQPQNVAEALRGLQAAPGPASVIAGGTDLLIDIQQGRHPPVHTLVDVTGIPDMRQIRIIDGHLYVGAAVTHVEILDDPLLRHHAACLVEACGLIGGPQVRNVATIGGNVAHALPAGDGTIALLALGAEVEIAGPSGARWIPLQDLFVAPGQTILGDCEFLLRFRFPNAQPGQASAFHRIMRPQGVAIAILNMAARLRLAPDGAIEELSLAVGPAGPRPFRARATETFLRGRRLDEESLTLAAHELGGEAHLRASPHRATAEYRQHILPVLLRRVLETAHARAMVS